MKFLFRFFFLFSFLMLSYNVQAQLTDSLVASLQKPCRLQFKLDTRNSFIASRRAQITGIKIGADFGKTLRIGGGFNFLNSNFTKEKNYPSPLGVDTILQKLKLRYMCYYIEYVFYRTPHWEFSVPVQFSVGAAWYNYTFKNVEGLRSRKHLVVLYEPTLSGQYKIFPWLGVGLDLGFRYALIKNKFIEEKLTSPIYVFKVLIYWGELYKKVFPNHPIEEIKKKIF